MEEEYHVIDQSTLKSAYSGEKVIPTSYSLVVVKTRRNTISRFNNINLQL